MNHEIELISDGDGLAVIGEPSAVERFLASEGLQSRDLGLARLSKVTNIGTAGAQAAAATAADSGRWVRLTEESAQKVKKYGLTPSKEGGVSHAMIGKPGQVKSWLQVDNVPGRVPTSPALLANAPALMAQLAMQQAMDEITDYLAVIDAKLDDVLRAQTDTVLSKMIGVGMQVDEAMTIRLHVGRVNEVTWSKVQDTAGTIADTQAYALRQLDALAERLERKTTVAELMRTALEAEVKTREWLAVLARCFQLQEGIAVLELDRVMETAPEDLEGHRLGLKAARDERLVAISQTTIGLLSRMHSAAETANSKVLFNPVQSPAVVAASAQVAASVGDFHESLGMGLDRDTVERRRWAAAAGDIRDRARVRGVDTLTAGKRLGAETAERVSSETSKLAGRIRDRTREKRDADGSVDRDS
jgi:hypothetical protein